MSLHYHNCDNCGDSYTCEIEDCILDDEDYLCDDCAIEENETGEDEDFLNDTN